MTTLEAAAHQEKIRQALETELLASLRGPGYDFWLALANYRRLVGERTWGRWTAAKRVGPYGSIGEVLGDRRLFELQEQGTIASYEHIGNRSRLFPLKGIRGTTIGFYTPDHRLYLRGGVTVYVEWKGRVSRDYPLRAALFRDNYCTGFEASLACRLDEVPADQTTIGSYDPIRWPAYIAETEAARKRMTAAKGAATRAATRDRARRAAAASATLAVS